MIRAERALIEVAQVAEQIVIRFGDALDLDLTERMVLMAAIATNRECLKAPLTTEVLEEILSTENYRSIYHFMSLLMQSRYFPAPEWGLCKSEMIRALESFESDDEAEL